MHRLSKNQQRMRALPVCRINGDFGGKMRYIGKGVQRLLNGTKYHGAVIQRDAVQASVLARVKREADAAACYEDSLDAPRVRCVACLAELLECSRVTVVPLWYQQGGNGGTDVNWRIVSIPCHVQIPVIMGAH